MSTTWFRRVFARRARVLAIVSFVIASTTLSVLSANRAQSSLLAQLFGQSSATIRSEGPGDRGTSSRAHALSYGTYLAAPQAGTATFIKTDAVTQGNWKTIYGTTGYSIAGDATDLPIYSEVDFSGAEPYTWASSSSDLRALKKRQQADRVAATWFAATPFTIDVNFTDASAHQVALYCLDWDRGGRAEMIEALDGETGQVLDTRQVSSFSNGQYLVWTVNGRVTFRVTKQSGYNSVVSGIFIDPATVSTSTQTPTPTPIASVTPTPTPAPIPTPTATPTPSPAQVGSAATFIASDIATKGNWKNIYGSEGYSVASDATRLPLYARLSLSGQSDHTWAQPTTDVRGLQLANTTGRIAATWFEATPFYLDVAITDARLHQVSVYCMDWDRGGRVQKIDVLDSATGIVLDTQNLTGFSGGVYLSWNVSGHVVFRATRINGYNAVISGLFFDPTGGAPRISPSPVSTPYPSPSPSPTAALPSPTPTPLPTPVATPPAGSARFAAPNGDGTACSLNAPCSLEYALSSAAATAIKPGDTVYLRGGLYQKTTASPNDSSTMFNVTIAGNSQAPITFRPYPGESVTIDGRAIAAIHIFYITGGGYLTFRDFEVMNSAYKLPPYAAACNPADPYNPSHIGPRTNCEIGGGYYGRGTAFNVSAPGIKIINNVIHDTGMGVFSGPASSDMEVTGNLIYFNGWNGPDRGHGHGIYGQNQTGQKIFRDNIIFGNYGYGIQAYGTSNSFLRNFVIDGNVIFGNGAIATNGWQPGLLLGGGAPVVNSQITNNHVYRPLNISAGHNIEIGYPLLISVMNQNVTVSGNHFIGGGPTLDLTSWQQATVTNNRVIGNSELFWLNQSMAATAYRAANTIDNNNYIFQRLATSIQPFRIMVEGGSIFGGSLGGWQSQTGFDLHSTYGEALPNTQEVFVRPNPYQPGRANIIVYNWSGSGVASVDVSSVLYPGDIYEVRNAQNFMGGPILSGVYYGSPLQLPLSGLTTAKPVGLGSSPQLTGNDFGAFVLIKVADGATFKTIDGNPLD